MFYVTSKLELAPGVERGSRFGGGEVLALDPSFFAALEDGSVSYKTGLLARTAVVALDQTYEDSLMVTARLARDTAATITMMRPVSLGRSANLQSFASVGDDVGPNSPLAVFENVSDEADVAALLSRVGREFDEAIAELSRNVAVAKYGGRIVEARAYYNVDPSELSESLRAYLAGRLEAAGQRATAGAGAPPGEPVRSGAPERVSKDKVYGEPIDGVLIMYFIQMEDVAGPGDKYVTGGSALKGIVSKVLEDGEEPMDEGGKQVDYIISPLSIVSRMTTDAFLNLWCNSCLVGLKEACLKILDS
jgi:DNA-directed RNA polymerase beta subunit